MGALHMKRSTMTLYSAPMDVYSHRVRIVLAEKGVTVDVLQVDPDDLPADLLDINPNGILPTLIDRDLVLNQSNVIMEYLDERFPHPPLLPVYPVARARSRLMIYQIEKDWYTLVNGISKGGKAGAAAAKEFKDLLIQLIPAFAEMEYFLSPDFSLVDCCIAPLLWRLPHYGIDLPPKAKPINEYMDKVFERMSFQASLTEHEAEIRESDDF